MVWLWAHSLLTDTSAFLCHEPRLHPAPRVVPGLHTPCGGHNEDLSLPSVLLGVLLCWEHAFGSVPVWAVPNLRAFISLVAS